MSHRREGRGMSRRFPPSMLESVVGSLPRGVEISVRHEPLRLVHSRLLPDPVDAVAIGIC